MVDLQDILDVLVGWLVEEREELANDTTEVINTMNNNLRLFPLLRIVFGDARHMHHDCGQVAEVLALFLMDGAVPVMVITEGAQTTVGSTNTVELGQAVVALDSIRNLAHSRWAHRHSADASEELIGR